MSTVFETQSSEKTHDLSQEFNTTIGSLPVSVVQEFGAVNVVIDMHRNGHEVSGDNPKLQLAKELADAFIEAVPQNLLNKQDTPIVERDENGKRKILPGSKIVEIKPTVRTHHGTMTVTFITGSDSVNGEHVNHLPEVFERLKAKAEALKADYPSKEPTGFVDRIKRGDAVSVINDILRERHGDSISADQLEQTATLIADALRAKGRSSPAGS